MDRIQILGGSLVLGSLGLNSQQSRKKTHSEG
jgi:hypothetical protein